MKGENVLSSLASFNRLDDSADRWCVPFHHSRATAQTSKLFPLLNGGFEPSPLLFRAGGRSVAIIVLQRRGVLVLPSALQPDIFPKLNVLRFPQGVIHAPGFPPYWRKEEGTGRLVMMLRLGPF